MFSLLQDLAIMGTDQINGFSHTTLSLSHDTAYNLLAVDSNQRFSAHLHTTNHGVEKNYYTKATSIGYNGKMYVCMSVNAI